MLLAICRAIPGEHLGCMHLWTLINAASYLHGRPDIHRPVSEAKGYMHAMASVDMAVGESEHTSSWIGYSTFRVQRDNHCRLGRRVSADTHSSPYTAAPRSQLANGFKTLITESGCLQSRWHSWPGGKPHIPPWWDVACLDLRFSSEIPGLQHPTLQA